MRRSFDRHIGEADIERLSRDGRERIHDELALEEPLEIRVDGAPLAVTMRTPGEDEELAAGFLAGEGLVEGAHDIVSVGPAADLAANIVEVKTRSGLTRDAAAERRFYLSSSCGVCGKAALEFVDRASPGARREASISLETVLRAPDELRERQTSFDRTGGLHASSLFEPSGEMIVLREDVGRHNALDKAIGSMLLAGRFPLPGLFACLSGRASFELVQKASVAGLAGLVAVGAPSTLAVALAREQNMLLCGFVRGESLNVYSGSDRILR